MRALVFATVLSSTSAVLGIELDVMNRCAAAASVVNFLADSSNTASPRCGPTVTPLEREIRAKVRRLGGSELCWISSPDFRVGAGFRCSYRKLSGSSDLVCVRPATRSDILAFKSDSDRLGLVNRAYMTDASRCEVFLRGVSPLPVTMMPQLLTLVGAHEFAFGASIGLGDDGDGMFVHGFARSADDLRGGTPDAFEYISVNRSHGKPPQVTRSDTGKRIGPWLLRFDESGEYVRSIESMLRKIKTDFKVDFPFAVDPLGWEFELVDGRYDAAQKSAFREVVFNEIASAIEEDQFREFSKSDLAKATGTGEGDLMKHMTKELPYGIRSLAQADQSKLRVFAYEGQIRCSRSGNGAIGAIAMQIELAGKPQRYFGGYGVVLFALGDCASSQNTPSQRLRKGVIENVRKQLTATLERAK